MSITYISYTDADHDPSEIREPRTEEQFQETLTRAVASSSPEELFVVDLEDVVLFKLVALKRTLGWLAENVVAPVCLLGVNSEIAFHILNETEIASQLVHRQLLWLVCDKVGAKDWLGCNDRVETEKLSAIIDGTEYETKRLSLETSSCIKRAPQLFVVRSDHHVLRHANVDIMFSRMLTHLQERLMISIERSGIRKLGHYKLPGGMHSRQVFESSLVLNDAQLVARIAHEIARRMSRIHLDAIVTSSLVGYGVAKEVSDRLHDHPSVIEAYGYPQPRLATNGPQMKDLSVLLLSDVVSSGSSVTNLRNEVERLGGRVVSTLTIIDVGGSADRIGVDALLNFPDKQYTRADCPHCASGHSYAEIDPFTSMPLSPVATNQNVKALLSSEAFWQLVIDNESLREGHLSFNGHHFSIFVETDRILRNSAASRSLGDAIVQDYGKSGLLFDCIVFPVHEGALALARAVWEVAQASSERPAPVLIPASRALEGGYSISDSYSERLRNSVTLILDDGVNFGDTLAGLYFAVTDFQPRSIDCCVFVDRLSPFYRKRLSAVLGSSILKSLYHLPIPAFHKVRCPICKRRRELRRLLTSAVGSDVKQFVKTKLKELEVCMLDKESDDDMFSYFTSEEETIVG
jgi:orotate phosphoribosyltransferase